MSSIFYPWISEYSDLFLLSQLNYFSEIGKPDSLISALLSEARNRDLIGENANCKIGRAHV